MMITVQSGKEFSLTARIRDEYGQMADPEEQEIILIDPQGRPLITLKTPEKISTGIFRATFVLPEDTQEGKWQISWMTVIHGMGATDITDIKIMHEVVGKLLEAPLIDIPRRLTITFLGGAN